MGEQEFVDALDEGASIATQWQLLFKRRPDLRPGLLLLRDYIAVQAEAAQALSDADLVEFGKLNLQLTQGRPPWTAAPEITARLREFIAAHPR